MSIENVFLKNESSPEKLVHGNSNIEIRQRNRKDADKVKIETTSGTKISQDCLK